MFDTVQILVDAIRQLGPVGLAAAAVGGFATETGAELFRQTKTFLMRKLAGNLSATNALEALAENPHNRIAETELIHALRHELDAAQITEEAKQLSASLDTYWKTDAGRQVIAKNYIERLDAQPGSIINFS